MNSTDWDYTLLTYNGKGGMSPLRTDGRRAPGRHAEHARPRRPGARPGRSIATWGTPMSQFLGPEDYLDEQDFDWANNPRNVQTKINVKL